MEIDDELRLSNTIDHDLEKFERLIGLVLDAVDAKE